MLTLRRDVDQEIVDLLIRIPAVKLALDAPETAAVFDGNAYPVTIEAVEHGGLQRYLDASDLHKDSPARVLVVNAVLDSETAARLEDAGVGYLDVSGRRWLPGLRRTKRMREGRPPVRGALRAASLRLTQFLADHPEVQWTERRLADRAGTTQTTAHRLLVRLEEEHLVERRGAGRGMHRQVGDVAGLRRWLSREGRPGRVMSLSCFVRDPDNLPDTVGTYELALTGAVAAERIGVPVVTSAHRPSVRVSAGPEEIESVPEALGGFRVEEGANLTLLADPQRLAFADRWRARGGRVAPPSRVMLDLYLEPRGDAAVDVFLDLWGSRITDSE